jgi:hypothetical protein
MAERDSLRSKVEPFVWTTSRRVPGACRCDGVIHSPARGSRLFGEAKSLCCSTIGTFEHKYFREFKAKVMPVYKDLS